MKSSFYYLAFSIGLCAMLAVSCSFFQKKADVIVARADIQSFVPRLIVGTIFFTDAGTEGLKIKGTIQGLLPDSLYAISINTIGNCENSEAPGLRFDPGNSNHHAGPGGSPGSHYAGDLPNIKANNRGEAEINYTTNAIGIGNSAFSIIGRSFVLYSNKDDFVSQPDGNAGVRIACGVINHVQKN